MTGFRVGLRKVAQETRDAQPKPQRMGWRITTADGTMEVGRYDDARVAHAQAVRMARSTALSKFQLWENAGGGSWVKVAEYEGMQSLLPAGTPLRDPEEERRAARSARILASVAKGLTSDERWADAMTRSEVSCLRRFNNS